MSSSDTLQFFDLSQPWEAGVPNWPYFEDVKTERVHHRVNSRVLTPPYLPEETHERS